MYVWIYIYIHVYIHMGVSQGVCHTRVYICMDCGIAQRMYVCIGCGFVGECIIMYMFINVGSWVKYDVHYFVYAHVH